MAALLFAFGCNKGENAKTDTAQTDTMDESTPAGDAGQMAGETGDTTQTAEPDYITVQHILIGFEGSVPGKSITRTREEAATLAGEILARAQGGEDFDAMVKEYTDDAYPGIYKMANLGVQADIDNGVYPRDQMVPAFGDAGFPLAVGEIGMAGFDPARSPYGWHVVKRVE
jgi:hypothetical protein